MDRVIFAPSGVNPKNRRDFAGLRKVAVVEVVPHVFVVRGVYNALTAQLDNDPSTRFFAVCESHSFLVGSKLMRTVADVAVNDHDWCEECQKLVDGVHTRDEHCVVGDNGCCTVCGVSHGDPCPDCGGRGFHNEGCAS